MEIATILQPHRTKPISSIWQLTILSLLAVAYTLHVGQSIFFPIALAIIVYFLLRPVVRYLTDYHVPKVVSAGFILMSFVASIGYALSFLMAPAMEWIERAPSTLRTISHKLSFLISPIQKISSAATKVEDLATMGKKAEESVVAVSPSHFGYTVFDITSNAFSATMVTFILLFFLLVYGDRLLEKLGSVLKSEGSATEGDILTDIEAGISNYLLTFSCVNIGLALAIGGALWLFGVPNAALWGAMAGLLNFIPYLGAIIGSFIVLIVTVISFNGFWQMIGPPCVYILINSIEGQFVTPFLLGSRLSLNPLVILLTMIIWGWIWGIGGAILAVPLLAIFRIVCAHVPTLQAFGQLLDD